jgi:hypothetical protein
MKTVLLKHKNWVIVNEGSIPSSNYCLFNLEKATRFNETGELPSFGIAYCSSIQNALTSLFQQMIIGNCKSKNYKPTLKGLSKIIHETKHEFNDLLTPKILKEIRHDKN